MLRRCTAAQMRVLCLTMLPDGGALTPALTTLGYKPYSLRSSFQRGHASTHPIAWSQMLDRKAPLNKAMFAEYDCFVGPPAALLYDVILRDCPSYTKVVLVEEADKAAWARNYDEYLAKVNKAMRRTSKNKITVAFQKMLNAMVVRGAAEGEGDGGAAAAPVPSSVSKYSYASSAAAGHRTSTPSDLERALRAGSAGITKPPQKQQQQPEEEEKAASAVEEAERAAAKQYEAEARAHEVEAGEEEEEPVSPRALALERFEESVKMAIPSSRLLVYRYGDGWEPLCEFLERPVPEEPFPPYDNGLRVLGFLQERIQWAETIMYVVVAITAAIVLMNAWPYLGGVKKLVGEVYQDYQLAFGSDSGAEQPRKPKAPAEAFEDAWKQRGGVVTVDAPKRA